LIPRALKFENGALDLLDQRRLPGEVVWLRCSSALDVARAIQALVVRGAPAIGVAAAYGMALAAEAKDLSILQSAAVALAAARPTAVNLHWAVARMRSRAEELAARGADLAAGLTELALQIHAEDEAMCRAIGQHGLTLLSDNPIILTHCNAGALATGGMGTALAPIYLAHEQKRAVRVYACEARPVMQGARLTTWELSQAGVPVTLLVDSAAAFLLSRREVESIWVGADRIAANGDVANKIGTHGLACAAARYGIPFYVAAPASTFDDQTPTGQDIPIEMRSGDELSERFAEPVSATSIETWTPAFDVTPRELVTAYVTDTGIRPGGRGQNP
jgi:methylthioribose-1-phosphate isomerase